MLRAEGKVFTGGVDVHNFDGLDEGRGGDLMGGLELIQRIEDLPIPTLSAVHALCLTAGFELSLAFDLIWAAESATVRARRGGRGAHAPAGEARSGWPSAPTARAREFVMSQGLYDAATLGAGTW